MSRGDFAGGIMSGGDYVQGGFCPTPEKHLPDHIHVIMVIASQVLYGLLKTAITIKSHYKTVMAGTEHLVNDS